MSGASSMTCIVCPRGCRLLVSPCAEFVAGSGIAGSGVAGSEVTGSEVTVSGAACRRGEDYAIRELRDPRRVLTSTLRTKGAALRRLPVRSSAPLPLGRLKEAVAALDELVAEPPLARGAVLARNFLGLGVDILATDELRAAAR